MAKANGKNLSAHHSATADDLTFLDSVGDPGSDGVPMFNTWTQFSGMPTHNVSENASTFQWDTFTPPSSPPFGASYGGLDTNTNYLSQILTNIRNSPTGIEPDVRLADQSIQGGVNYQNASLEDQDIYVQTLKNWNSFSSNYDPFVAPEVLRSSSPQEVADVGQKSHVKPTYSDIAKSLKSKPMQTGKEKEDDSQKRKFPDPIVTKPYKPFTHKTSRKTTRQHSRVSLPDDMESKVSPDSKYGLDSFDDIETVNIEKQKSESVESLPQLSRKGSTSSISSGTSGIEEIHLTKPLSSYTKKENSSNKSREQSEGTNSQGNKADKPEKPFFDARRIFQRKPTRDNNGSKQSSDPPGAATVLNNGKPAGPAKTSNTNHKKTTDYINNDLRDAKKKTNQYVQNKDSEKRENLVQNGKLDKKTKQTVLQTENHNTGRKRNRSHMSLQPTFDQEYIDEWINFMYDKCKSVIANLWSGLVTCVLLLFGLIAYLVSYCVQFVIWIWLKISTIVKTKIFKKYFPSSATYTSDAHRKIGLDANIVLPSTGDEAMQRLLACKGKDPYSILGLQCDTTDEDIKKYYRKQAVLVHPDKNKQPGAEEAFKILGHAFEHIGEPEKRRQYDHQLAEAYQAETAMKEFNDLMTKLQEKIQEAANMMRCDNCGGKHKRIPVDRPWYSARFCKRCNIRHSAKEGDVWAETKVFGFLWNYYACMEGKIYDITEWVSCKKDYFKHMQASAHHIFYRIATEGSRGNNNQQGRSGEAELEDFINHLFHQAMNTEQGTDNQWQQPEPQASTHQNSTSSAKKSRRRKKKH